MDLDGSSCYFSTLGLGRLRPGQGPGAPGPLSGRGTILGWEPRVSLEEGLPRTIESLKRTLG